MNILFQIQLYIKYTEYIKKQGCNDGGLNSKLIPSFLSFNS